jgi:hypothetical protein
LVYKSVTIKPLQVIVALPDVSLSTGAARDALPKEVSLKDVAQNVGRAALVVQALLEGDYALLGEAMRDRLHEPYRKKLIPGFDEASQAARSKGASAVAISGAGPALVALAEEEHDRIARAMAQAFKEATGKPARTWILPVDTQGIAISEMATEMPLSTMRVRARVPEREEEVAAAGLKEAEEAPEADSKETQEAPEAPKPETVSPPAVQETAGTAKPLGLGEAAELLRGQTVPDDDKAKSGGVKSEPAQADDSGEALPT